MHKTLIPLIIIISLVYSGEFDSLLTAKGFKENKVPERWDKTYDKLNNSDEYEVLENDSLIIISDSATSRAREVTYTSGEITYTGTNHGEWGGYLVATKGTINDTLITDNIRNIIPIIIEDEKALIVITGLAHMSSSRGSIYAVRHINAEPKVELITLLPDLPSVVIPTKEQHGPHTYYRFDIVGYSSAMSVTIGNDFLPNHFNMLLWDTFWAGLYPHSAIKRECEILIGIRGGVVVLHTHKPHFGRCGIKKQIRFFMK